MIRVLFIHQNLPGQLRRSMRYVQTRLDDQLAAIGEAVAVRRAPSGPTIRVIGWHAALFVGDVFRRAADGLDAVAVGLDSSTSLALEVAA